MAEPARKLGPNEHKDQYLRKIGEDIKESQVDTTPDLQYLDSENGPPIEGEEYTPPDLQYLGDEDEQEGEDETEREVGDQLTPDDIKRALKKTKKVPEYSKKPPAKYQPGGPAIKAKGQPTAAAKPGVGQTATNEAGVVAKKGAQAAVDAAAQAAKKAAAQAAKWAAQMGAKVIAATAEYWFPILMAIIAIVIIVFAVIMLVRALQTPNANGSSPVQAADVINDKPWITKILALAGDKDIANKLTVETLNGLNADLTTLESEINAGGYDQATKTKGIAKINEIKALITQFIALQPTDTVNRTQVAKNIVKAVGELIDIFAAAPFHYAGPTANPVASKNINGYNGSLHGGTPRKRWSDAGHNTFIGWLRGWADATDVGGRGGTPIYAAFDAKVDDVRTRYGTVFLVSGTDSEGKKWQATYAHMQNTRFGKGDTIHVGEQIGEMSSGLNSPHLHFELVCNGKAVVTTPEDVSDHNQSNRKYEEIGKYLYLRDLSALNRTL